MNEAASKKLQVLAASALAVGMVLLLLAAFLPTRTLQLGDWTEQEAQKRGEISDQMHEARSRLSAKEYAAQRKKLDAAHEAMSKKLAAAIEGPELWKSRLKWGGVTLVCIGAVGYVLSRSHGS